MLTRGEILAKKKHLPTTDNFAFSSLALTSLSKEREGDLYIRFCFVGSTTCNLQPTRRPAINVSVGYKSLSQSMKITFKSKKFRRNAWCGLDMQSMHELLVNNSWLRKVLFGLCG